MCRKSRLFFLIYTPIQRVLLCFFVEFLVFLSIIVQKLTLQEQKRAGIGFLPSLLIWLLCGLELTYIVVDVLTLGGVHCIQAVSEVLLNLTTNNLHCGVDEVVLLGERLVQQSKGCG